MTTTIGNMLAQPESPLDFRDSRPHASYGQRILYVASTRHSGGLEVASIRLADLLLRQTDARQREIVFACRPGQYIEARCQSLGIPTAGLLVRNSGDLTGVRTLIDIIMRERIGIVHVHSRRDYVTAVLAKAIIARRDPTRTPKLLLHMHLLRPLGSPSFLSGAFFGPQVDRFLAVSQAVREYLLRKHRQLRPDQVAIVPNSVEIEQLDLDLRTRAQIRSLYGLPADALVIGMVGRLDTKGQDEAIKAIAALNRHDIHLMLVGAAGKRGYLARLERLARKRGVADRVIFCGSQENIGPYLRAMDIFLHLPRDEAFGLAPAEAMAVGLPVLASRVGGCIELIEEEKTGLLAGPRNRAEIQSRLGDLIDAPAFRSMLGVAGGASIRGRFSTDEQIRSLGQIYDDLSRTNHYESH